MHNYFLLTAEADFRHSEHERRVMAVTNDVLTAGTNQSWLTSLRHLLARIQSLALERLPIREAPAARLSLGADRAGN